MAFRRLTDAHYGNRHRIRLPKLTLNDNEWKQRYIENIHLGPSESTLDKYQLRDNKVVTIKEIVVYSFNLADVEDPDLMAAEPLWKWQQTPAGKWILENAEETPVWTRQLNYATYGQQYCVQAKLTEQKLVEYYLKFGKP